MRRIREVLRLRAELGPNLSVIATGAKLRLSEWQKASGRGLSMRQVHRAGETVQVDYAGDTVPVMEGGTARAAQIFVACLPCSGLIYADA
jgi:hypothetical protein